MVPSSSLRWYPALVLDGTSGHFFMFLLLPIWCCHSRKTFYSHVISLFRLTNSYEEPSWSQWYDNCIYNYLCNHCLYPLTLWVRIQVMARSTRNVIKFVSDLRQVGDFLRVLRFPPSIKLTATIWLIYFWRWRKTPLPPNPYAKHALKGESNPNFKTNRNVLKRFAPQP
jgi:hypothetical protein